MAITLAFDVYGTLIDTHGVQAKLQEYIGDQAELFSTVWREKQLEYSFRRGLMRLYENFAVCTRQALDFTDTKLGTQLTTAQKSSLLDSYKTLPAFDDAPKALAMLKAEGHGLYAFSNGSADAVEGLLLAAGMRGWFDGVVSVDPQQTFKPNPDVYANLISATHADVDKTWLISSNPFDVIGAVSFGLKSAWVKRSDHAVFDPWGIEPTAVITGLGELSAELE